MVWGWVIFGLVILFLLFLVVYLLDHWQTFDVKQRTSFICNIVTMMIVALTAWTSIGTTQRLQLSQQQQLRGEAVRLNDSILKQYEQVTLPKILIRTNQDVEESIKIQIKEGTKIFYQYDGEIKRSH